MNNKQAAVKMVIQRGGLIPIDTAMQLSEEGVFLQEFEDSIDGFSVEEFIDNYDFYENT